ncbi:MAG: hypothetical protein KDK41_05515 [Leptospiraceae bacterium]|nr:hypothetical protein [Leptospiraceae bacterium]MCB1200083.1 hypothetical protein [Leptospiraceae bacterium]
MRRLPNCPYCGKEKQFACTCEYGKIMKMKMDPSERDQDFYKKRYCPKCGSSASEMTCKKCNFSFSAEDFWHKKGW